MASAFAVVLAGPPTAFGTFATSAQTGHALERCRKQRVNARQPGCGPGIQVGSATSLRAAFLGVALRVCHHSATVGPHVEHGLEVAAAAARKAASTAGTAEEGVDDVGKLLRVLPAAVAEAVERHALRDALIEVVLDLGRPVEMRFAGGVSEYLPRAVEQADLDAVVAQIGEFGGDNRAGIERTLHRISCMRNRQGKVIGLTCRAGRAVFGTIEMIRDLVTANKSILLLGRPGVGKTTAIREIARVFADELGKRVVIIDTSNEIAGDGDIPHPAIGRARRMQVQTPEEQHRVMIEAVENHMPEVIVIDEIGTELEAQAARTIAERGVILVGTAHGNYLENLIKNPTLSDLVGGIQSVTLGDDEARRRGTQKSILERKAPPTFDVAVEMAERERWTVHADVSFTVDCLLQGRSPSVQVRSLGPDGKVEHAYETLQPLMLGNPASAAQWGPGLRPALSSPPSASHRSGGFRSSGKMMPQPFTPLDFPPSSIPAAQVPAPFSTLPRPVAPARAEAAIPFDEAPIVPGSAQDLARAEAEAEAEGGLIYVYPYEVSRGQVEQAAAALHLPVVVTGDVARADALLALRSYARANARLRTLARQHDLPVYTMKSATMPHVSRALRALCGLDSGADDGDDDAEEEPAPAPSPATRRPPPPAARPAAAAPAPPRAPRNGGSARVIAAARQAAGELRAGYGAGGAGKGSRRRAASEDEIEALEEARLAVERVVIPKQQLVELLPRSAEVVELQAALCAEYRLSVSRVEAGPQTALRIYPMQ